jgi:hypothetical protein
VISAEVMRALRVAGYPAEGASLENMLGWLVQHRQVAFEVSIDAAGRWHAVGSWPGPDRSLEADGQSAADAVAKIVLDVIARESAPHPTSR